MTKFQAGTILTSLVMDYQVHAIGKAIRPLFSNPVTYILQYNYIRIAKEAKCMYCNTFVI